MKDMPQLERVMQHMQEITARIRADQLDMVEYGLALAVAARNIQRNIQEFGGPDVERYERLGKILQEILAAP